MVKAAWKPQPGPQANAISADWCEELLFGGAKYGGKSDFLLGDFLKDVKTYGSNWQGIIYRRSMPELDEVVRRSTEFYPKTGAEWKEQKKTWFWPNGASLKMRQLERKADIGKYQGHSYTWIGFDELGNWPSDVFYRQVGLANLRWAAAPVPTKRIRASANPGGVGHSWIKDYFINHAPLGYKPRIDDDTQNRVMFIPSRITDNILGVQRDPNYINRLKGMGSATMVKAWLEGDWEIVTGAYFPELGVRHIIKPFQIPQHWSKYMGYDWGYHSPFAAVWAAVSSGKDDSGREVPYPKGSLIFYREYTGKGIENSVQAQRIRTLSAGEDPLMVADPSIFKTDGGQSIADQFRANGVNFRPGDNARISGWNEVRKRLYPDPPMMYIFETCEETRSTLASLPICERNNEDADTEANDHIPDAVRYLCKQRALPTDYREKQKPDRMGKIQIARHINSKRRSVSKPTV